MTMDSLTYTKDSLEYFVTYDLAFGKEGFPTGFTRNFWPPPRSRASGSTISQYCSDLDLRLKILSFDEFFLVLRIEVVDQSQLQ